MYKIFREELKISRKLYKKCSNILSEKDFFKILLNKKIEWLSNFLSKDEIINYLFHVLNIYVNKIQIPSFFHIYKIDFILWRTKLNQCLNLKERNRLYLYKNMILSKSRLIKTLPIKFNNENEKTYAELKCYSFEININQHKNTFNQCIIYISDYYLTLLHNNLFKCFSWNTLIKYEVKNECLYFEFKEIKIKIVFNDPYGDVILFNRLMNKGYIKWKTTLKKN